MTEKDKLLQYIDNQLFTIRQEYIKMDVQRARLEGKEVILLDLKDSIKALP